MGDVEDRAVKLGRRGDQRQRVINRRVIRKEEPEARKGGGGDGWAVGEQE